MSGDEAACSAEDTLNEMARARQAQDQQLLAAGMVGEGAAAAATLFELAKQLVTAIKTIRDKAQACEIEVFWQRDGVKLEMRRLKKGFWPWNRKFKLFTFKLKDGRNYQTGATGSAQLRKEVLLSGMFYRLFIPMVKEHIKDPKFTKGDLIALARRYLEDCQHEDHINEFLSVPSIAEANKQLADIKPNLMKNGLYRFTSTYNIVLKVNDRNYVNVDCGTVL